MNFLGGKGKDETPLELDVFVQFQEVCLFSPSAWILSIQWVWVSVKNAKNWKKVANGVWCGKRSASYMPHPTRSDFGIAILSLTRS